MWKQGKRAHLTVANYIRYNTHVELLAQCYAFWVQIIDARIHRTLRDRNAFGLG